MKGLLIGITTFLLGFFICILSTILVASGGNAEHIGMATLTAVLYLSAVVATCTYLLLERIKCK